MENLTVTERRYAKIILDQIVALGELRNYVEAYRVGDTEATTHILTRAMLLWEQKSKRIGNKLISDPAARDAFCEIVRSMV